MKRNFQRLTGLILLALLPTMGASIPVLDIHPEDVREGVEDQHHPGTHGLPHNHLICIQQAASQWMHSHGFPPAPVAVEAILAPIPPGASPVCFSQIHLPPCRAPPGA